MAGRYGGEEFAVILTDSAVDNAVTVAERLRRLAEHSQVEHEGQIIKFNISVGLAEFSPLCDSPMEWLERADQALYQAKQTGRNKYCVWQEQ